MNFIADGSKKWLSCPLLAFKTLLPAEFLPPVRRQKLSFQFATNEQTNPPQNLS